jgi:hypothetical protein
MGEQQSNFCCEFGLFSERGFFGVNKGERINDFGMVLGFIG